MRIIDMLLNRVERVTRPDPEKLRVNARLTDVERRVAIVEGYQQAERVVRDAGRRVGS